MKQLINCEKIQFSDQNGSVFSKRWSYSIFYSKNVTQRINRTLLFQEWMSIKTQKSFIKILSYLSGNIYRAFFQNWDLLINFSLPFSPPTNTIIWVGVCGVCGGNKSGNACGTDDTSQQFPHHHHMLPDGFFIIPNLAQKTIYRILWGGRTPSTCSL